MACTSCTLFWIDYNEFWTISWAKKSKKCCNRSECCSIDFDRCNNEIFDGLSTWKNKISKIHSIIFTLKIIVSWLSLQCIIEYGEFYVLSHLRNLFILKITNISNSRFFQRALVYPLRQKLLANRLQESSIPVVPNLFFIRFNSTKWNILPIHNVRQQTKKCRGPANFKMSFCSVLLLTRCLILHYK